jgi:hypothetical protein
MRDAVRRFDPDLVIAPPTGRGSRHAGCGGSSCRKAITAAPAIPRRIPAIKAFVVCESEVSGSVDLN